MRSSHGSKSSHHLLAFHNWWCIKARQNLSGMSQVLAEYSVAVSTVPAHHDKTWIPDLLKGSYNYRFGWIRDTPIRLQIQRNKPCNLSTTNPLVINLAVARLTSPRRLTLACESKNTSKCMEKQPNHRKQLIQLTGGFHNRRTASCSWQKWTKQNPSLEEGVAAV
jgi:hypothetical protein